MKILLASNSPRRKELLQSLGFDFEVVSTDCDENFPSDLPADHVAAYISELKSNAFRTLKEGEVLITSDTVVAMDGEILGKPKDENDAKEMLEKLSGKTHQVFTAITIKTLDKTISRTDVANVEFESITDSECDFYIKKYNSSNCLSFTSSRFFYNYISILQLSIFKLLFFNINFCNI